MILTLTLILISNLPLTSNPKINTTSFSKGGWELAQSFSLKDVTIMERIDIEPILEATQLRLGLELELSLVLSVIFFF
jgi:hypothetical protein